MPHLRGLHPRQTAEEEECVATIFLNIKSLPQQSVISPIARQTIWKKEGNRVRGSLDFFDQLSFKIIILRLIT